jgi:hypothetical protein
MNPIEPSPTDPDKRGGECLRARFAAPNAKVSGVMLKWPSMKTQRFAIGVTVLNLLVLMSMLFRANSAPNPEIVPVLRGRALEIVDDQGRVRAMFKVFPADTNVKMPDGTTGYPETVLLRLIDSKGGPNVKIAATEDGSAMSLGGESDPTHIFSNTMGSPAVSGAPALLHVSVKHRQLRARPPRTSIKFLHSVSCMIFSVCLCSTVPCVAPSILLFPIHRRKFE